MPKLYARAPQSCAVEADLTTVRAADLTESAQGGAAHSGGQRARVCLARAAHRAALVLEDCPQAHPLVLLDDPFSSLDQSFASEACREVVAPSGGLQRRSCVVIATADSWWLQCVPETAESVGSDPQVAALTTRVAVVRPGRLVAIGTPGELHGFEFGELTTLEEESAPLPVPPTVAE